MYVLHLYIHTAINYMTRRAISSVPFLFDMCMYRDFYFSFFPSVVVVVWTFSDSCIIFCYFISTECYWQPFSFLFAHFIIRFRVVLNVQWHYVRFELVIGLSGASSIVNKVFWSLLGFFWLILCLVLCLLTFSGWFWGYVGEKWTILIPAKKNANIPSSLSSLPRKTNIRLDGEISNTKKY